MEEIRLDEMLELMETGNPFSIKFVSLDKQRKTGGEIKHIPRCVLTRTKKERKQHVGEEKFQQVVRGKRTKNPNHFHNSTRSVQEMIGDAKTECVRKFHLYLVLEFNGKKLIL